MDYEVEAGERGAYEKSLAAAAVDTVTFTEEPRIVEVFSDGTASIYVSTDDDDADPAVGDAKAHYLPATPCVREIPMSSASKTVRLISAGTPQYSVSRAD